MDTICIDKANLSELDKSIRSMYEWYANCRAVVLEPGTTLKEWKTRGWCLQEGAAANALYAISNGSLISIQKLVQNSKKSYASLISAYIIDLAMLLKYWQEWTEEKQRRKKTWLTP
jgi:hypothetical protein